CGGIAGAAVIRASYQQCRASTSASSAKTRHAASRKTGPAMTSILALLASRVCMTGACVCVVLLCSCATAPIWFADDSIRPPLPAETFLNKGTDRGDSLFVRLRLETGEELLFLVDTGSPCTVLDKSLESKLGKRVGTAKVKWLGGKGSGSVQRAPKLYLDRTESLTASRTLSPGLTPLPLLAC